MFLILSDIKEEYKTKNLETHFKVDLQIILINWSAWVGG